jgi:N-acetylneuraminic acid mutarotase
VDGKLYVFGGYTDATFVPTSRRTDVYDPATNAWTRLADAPIAITHAGVAVDGRVIYLAGCVCGAADGRVIDAMTDVRTYDTATDTWGTAPPLPAARGAGALVRLGRRLHFLGGTTADRSTAVTDHWVLNLDGGTRWTKAPSLPAGRNHVAAVALGGKIYLIGGQTGHLGGATARSEVYAYDPATKTWTQRASLPRPRSHITESAVVYRGRILVLGGEIDHGKPVAEVDEYDPATDTWTVLTPLPAARNSGVAGVIGTRVYYAMGAPGFRTTLFRGRISTASVSSVP